MTKRPASTAADPPASGPCGRPARNLPWTASPRTLVGQGPDMARPGSRTGGQRRLWKRLGRLAGVTGLEPAASGVTGRRSNQLSYTPDERQGLRSAPG